MCLKQKKMYENQLEQVENNMLRVSEQQMMLENQRITVETISALQNAAKASKTTMSEMDIDNVDKVLADISDTADQMQQIQEAMGQPLGAAADLDEDELEAELQEMEASEMDRELLRPAPVPATRLPSAAEAEAAMPSAPTRPVPAGKVRVWRGRAGGRVGGRSRSRRGAPSEQPAVGALNNVWWRLRA